MRRISLYRLTSLAITSVMVISMTSCSAKPSADTVETSTEAVTEVETETETEEETVSPSGNDVSSNDVSETEAESEADAEEEIEEESTNSKTSEKDSTKSETTTSETTTEAVTVQSVSAVVNGTHYVGETLTGADFTVTVTMSDGETLTNPAGWSAQPLTLNSTSNLITISYKGTSTTVTVPASVQTAGTGSSSGGSTGSISGSGGSTGSISGSGTSSASGSGTSSVSGSGSTDTASVTQGTTATATTAAEAAAEEIETIGEICGEGEYCYDYSYLLFQAENYVRESVGVSDMTWSNELYNVACKCAKACADAGSIDHSLTVKYRVYFVQNNYGELLDYEYDENLGHQISPSDAVYNESIADVSETYLKAIINSPPHYASMIGEGEIEAGVGVYKKDGMLYVSYIFHHIDGDKQDVAEDVAPDISDRYDPETWEIISYDEFIAKYKTSTNVYTY